MSGGKRFAGKAGVYTLAADAALPEAIGRASLIYRATDAHGAPVCVKVYKDPDALPGPSRPGVRAAGGAPLGYEHELDAYRELEHPNILRLVDFGTDAETGTLFLVLPWCEGGDLRRALARRQFFAPGDALAVLRPVALALDYAHGRGFTHGDVKPENVLFGARDDHPYLSDFGSTRRAAYQERVTASGAGRGTTVYLSPEQISDNETTTSSDVYAFGMVAYELLTGRMPVDEGDTAYRQMVAKISGALVPAAKANPRLPAHAAGALMNALDVDPARRPPSATALCEMLAGERRVPPARPPQAGRRLARLSQSQRVAIVVAVIAAAGAVLAAVVESAPSWARTAAPNPAGRPTRGAR